MLKRKLEDVLDYIQPTDYLVSSDQYSDEYSVPVLTAGQSFLLGYTNDEDGIYEATKDKPIILFDDFTTAIQWVDFPFKVKSSACKILAPKNDTNIRYMYYVILNQNFDHSQHKRYWISEFSKLQFNDYGPENIKIVNELDNIQKAINLKQNELLALEELIKSRFVEMFGRQSTNEKGLTYVTIGDVAEIYLGITHTPKYVDEGIIFISAKNTSKDYLDLSDVKYISKEEFETAPKGSKPKKNDVLFSRVGSNLGHPVILEDDLEICTFVSLGFLRSKGNVTSNYLKHWMRDDFFDAQIEEHVQGGGQPNLNTGWLKQFKIIVPDMKEQLRFDEFCNLIEKSKFVVQQQIKELQELLDKKMDEYFSE